MAKSSEKLTFQVSNFGPIAEGGIELRPLTIFLGPSKTGKSYFATLIYAFHRLFSDNSEVSPSDRIYARQYAALLHNVHDIDISNEQSSLLIDWAGKTFSEERAVPSQKKKIVSLPGEIADIVRLSFSPDKQFAALFGEEIRRFYGVEFVDSLVRYPGGSGVEIIFQRYVNKKPTLDYRFNIDGSKPSIAVSIPKTARLTLGTFPASSIFRRSLFYAESSEVDARERRSWAKYVINELAEAVYPYVIGSMNRPAYCLPAARTGIMHAHHVVMSAMIERATVAGIHPSAQLPTLNGVIADFLMTLMALRSQRLRASRKEMTKLAKSLEKNVLGGAVNIEKSPVPNMYPSFVYRPDGWDLDLPLMNTASMITELAPLVLYLRYVVQPGDTLIIEEPEAHLYPEMQAAVIRELAKAVHAGVRIIITTHSEWIVEALENIALASKLPEDKRGGVSLKPEDLGVWTFQHEKEMGGSVVKELPFDPEIGFDTEGYSRVAADLHNRWANISSEIERNETR